MSKQANPRRLADNEAKATVRMLRVSPQKLNLLAQLIRGKKVAAALADLEFSRKRISVEVKKALESAIANAENNHDLDVDDLVVAEAWVGKDMVMKRFAARARGRAGRIEKPFSNITIVVREVRRRSQSGLKEARMGQKINPIGLRLGINRTWDSRWFAEQDRVRQAPARGHEDPRGAVEGPEAGGDLEDRHRASAQEVPRSTSTRRARAWSSARRAPTSTSCASRSPS